MHASSNSLFDLPIGPIFIIVGIVVIFYLWTQYRQKMELIKKGESLIEIDALEQMKISHLSKGIITVALAMGIFSGYLLESYTSFNPWVAYPVMFLLFFGIGSLTFYGLIKNQ